MNAVMDYLKLTLSGFGSFIAGYKYLALIIGVLIYAIVHGRRYKSQGIRRFLLYAIVGISLLMIPATGMVFLIYQTRFYDYEWVWSFVPLTAVLAWGIVTVIFDELPIKSAVSEEEKEDKRKVSARLFGVVAAVAILFICGNQGKLQQVSEEEVQMQYISADILQYMESENWLQDRILWGPKDILQYMRSHNGNVQLFYGRDMWDAKSGAYDYDVYEAEEMACYEWMELVSSPHSRYLLEVDQAPEYIHEALAADEYLREAVERGTTGIILPSQIVPWMERKIQLIAEEKELSVTVAQVEEYTLWMLDAGSQAGLGNAGKR